MVAFVIAGVIAIPCYAYYEVSNFERRLVCVNAETGAQAVATDWTHYKIFVGARSGVYYIDYGDASYRPAEGEICRVITRESAP